MAGEIYHVFNRGVEKRHIFNNDLDRRRFILGLKFFNDKNPAPKINPPNLAEVGLPQIEDRLVDNMAFTLMSNHYHLLIQPRSENGLTEFMRKLGTGYTNYFNLKYGRVGPLFQGKYKIVHVGKENQLINLIHYIHVNPIETVNPGWKETGITNPDRIFKFLATYQWTSFGDYIGNQRYSNILSTELAEEYTGNAEEYKSDMKRYLIENDFNFLSNLTLE